eukprot:305476-Chlamydomonas_euryale.AAC.1
MEGRGCRRRWRAGGADLAAAVGVRRRQGCVCVLVECGEGGGVTGKSLFAPPGKSLFAPPGKSLGSH